MKVTREFKCFAGHCWLAGCCDCFSHEIKIEAPVGQTVGYIKQKYKFSLILHYLSPKN